jgi:hypothetical protein
MRSRDGLKEKVKGKKVKGKSADETTLIKMWFAA